MVLLLLATGVTLHAEPATPGALSARSLNDSFAGVFEKVAPSVVVIESETATSSGPVSGLPRGLEFFLRRPDGTPVPSEPNVGTGFLLRPDGYILTNFHVVEGADSVTVRLRDGRRFEAELVGTDSRTDLAVLKIDAKDLPAAEIGDSDAVRVGQFAFAIGTPMELPYTFTVGVVSAKDRSLGGSYGELIQTDASINPGNSGGPLADIDGRIIGVNTLISGMNRGIGFAIPINLATNIASQLIAEGRVRRPWLGISIAGIQESVQLQRLFPGVERGVVVQGIQPDAPALSSDLRPGDVILRVDGVEVAMASDLQKQILAKQIGQTVELDVWRQGRNVTLGVRTGEQPSFEQVSIRSRREKPEATPRAKAGSVEAYGLVFSDVTPEALKKLRLEPRDGTGALVTEVVPASPASVAGIEPGDIVTEAGGSPVRTAKDLTLQLSSGENASGLLLLLERRGTRTFAILKQ